MDDEELELFVRNDNTIIASGLKDPRANGIFIDDAVGSWQVRTKYYPNGSVIAEGSIAYVNGSAGDYELKVAAEVALVTGTTYILRIFGTSTIGKFDIERRAKVGVRTGLTPRT